ncbi:MAG: M20/M25/M40 family metallo-hydrolase [Clostridia bacterium]|nr:M20/M25/M40 family metallo-hydrolase [Clostridia bacterium]
MWWIIPLAAVAGLLVVLLVRAAAYLPAHEEKPEPDDVDADGEKAVENLAAMVRCRTVSRHDHSAEDAEEFQKFRDLLVDRYPLIHKTCTLDHIGRNGLLYKWTGQSAQSPSVFMAHYDVVPADPATWSKPPFDGLFEDGVLWGRGTLDTKGTLVGVVEAAERLISDGFVPENDIYFAFSGEEEIAGDSAADIVSELSRRGVSPALVLDEGGAVVDGIFPGVTAPCALIGTGEKGQMALYMEMESNGGHASAPPPHTIAGLLADAVTKIEGHPFPFNLTPPAAEMFDTLGRHSSFAFKLIFSNLWLFRGVLDGLCKKSGGELNALVRTTVAVTEMSGSSANNVLPPRASIGLNVRLMGGDTSDAAIDRIRGIAGNPDIKFRKGVFSEASTFSETGNDAGWQKVRDAVARTWPEAIVSPYLMIAGSDSRHYSSISHNVYRFSAMSLSKEERGLIHGNDERIPAEKVEKCVQFYIRLIKSC